MDEATANIDYKTDELIQNAIKEVMKHSTVITIAHRIKTILHYDRILVLNYGEVIEFDTPENLIENKDSLFYELYSKSHL
jgi:ATP-binding cassette, subfamily C (CFTR/MRP), member 1